MSARFFQFAHPFFLLLLLALPFLFYFYRRQKARLGFYYSSVRQFEGLPRSFKERSQFLLPFLRALTLALLVLALARPQFGNRFSETLSEGIDILLTIDTSGSMKALDFHLQGSEANRLDVVKKVVGDFVSKRPYDRIGMVVFGEEAYTQCPLTTDTQTLHNFLDLIRIGIAGDGTAIGNALATSVKRLKDQKTKSKIIILLTDGRNNAGQIAPEKAAQIAKEFNIKVYTIGVGSHGPVPYPEDTPFGVRKVYANLDFDEATLQNIASETGGKYFRATDTKELAEIYSTIDQLEKSEVKIKQFSEYNELYLYFLLPALFLFMLEQLLARTVFLRIP